MELVKADAGVTGNELATCLSSLTINVNADCKVYIGAPAADNSFLQSLWSSDSGAYTQFKLCPLTGPEIALSATDDATENKAAILLALNSYAYGLNGAVAAKTSGATIAYANGVLNVTIGSTGSLVYAIRDATADTVSKLNVATLVVADPTNLAAAGLAEGTEFRNADNIGEDCTAGHYGLLIGESVKLCPLCPAGTHGDGNGCTACAAGKASANVGVATNAGTPAASCPTTCAAGFYAQEGEC